MDPIREKRVGVSDEREVLAEGTSRTCNVAEETMQMVRNSIGLKYYEQQESAKI